MPREQADHTSSVPHFTFADTLTEQEEQLAQNPLLERFRQSRRSLAQDRHRPCYHFVNPESTLNDPNGLCFWRGRWHLFYQAYPPEDPRQHWGHAVSEDLIHWQDLPYAIYPHPEGRCFSGATFVEPDRVIAMYHGTEAGNMIAVSHDPLLLNWQKLTNGPVIPLPAPDRPAPPYKIFDPCIWKKDGHYYSLSGGTAPHPHSRKHLRAEFLFRSPDLVHWEYLHPFIEGDCYGLVGDDGACPYFWPIGARHILLHYSHMSGGKYLLGDYDTARDRFLVTDGGDFNFGPFGPGGVHAPSACPDGNGGVIVIFNMNPARPCSGWDQIMSLPRRLTLTDNDVLTVQPAGAIESLRTNHRSAGPMSLPAQEEIVLEGIEGNALELDLEITPQDADMIELNVLRSPQREEFTRIAFYPQRGYRDWGYYAGPDRTPLHETRDSLITIDSSYSSTLPDVRCRAPETAPVYIPPQDTLRLRVFIDKSVVEVFVNDRQCVALRVYPGRPDSTTMSLRAQGRPAVLKRLDAWQMKSITDAT